MTLDEAEKLAKLCEHGTDFGVRDLARALLAVLPVVRAAISAQEFAERHPYGSRGDDDLENAINEMHDKLGGS